MLLTHSESNLKLIREVLFDEVPSLIEKLESVKEISSLRIFFIFFALAWLFFGVFLVDFSLLVTGWIFINSLGFFCTFLTNFFHILILFFGYFSLLVLSTYFLWDLREDINLWDLEGGYLQPNDWLILLTCV